jgi:hypothetical protein
VVCSNDLGLDLDLDVESMNLQKGKNYSTKIAAIHKRV